MSPVCQKADTGGTGAGAGAIREQPQIATMSVKGIRTWRRIIDLSLSTAASKVRHELADRRLHGGGRNFIVADVGNLGELFRASARRFSRGRVEEFFAE